MSFGMKGVLHIDVVKSEDEKLYNYLAHEKGEDVLDVYLYSAQDNKIGAAYKAEVTPTMLSTVAEKCEKSSGWMKNLLFLQERDILWCIETNKSSAKVTWKRNLANGMKLTLGSVTMEEHPSAPSDMLSICAAGLKKETSKTISVEGKCENLEKENARLRQLAEEAVAARQLLEDDLIAKFARLLNEKKAKIRALQEMLAERRAHELDGAVGTDGAPDASPPTPARPPSEEADQPDSDAYDQETDVDTDGEEEPVPGPSREQHHPPNDSLELDCDGLDDAPPVRPKRPAPDTAGTKRPPVAEKRRMASSDDLMDIV